MSKSTRTRIPVNIIAGTLGVGKTTTINHLLALRPHHERWAILVNEYGLIGIDAALMTAGSQSKSSDVDIKEIAGGCICCSAGFMFEVSLVRLLQRRPDRLLIEPTGLAALSGILDILHRPGIREAVDLRSVFCLLDPSSYKDSLCRPEVQDQVDAADILLASRSDLASSEQIHSFFTWANQIFPPKKRVEKIVQGQISLDLLDAMVERDSVITASYHQHGTDHKHHHAHHSHSAEEYSDTSLPLDATQNIIQHLHHSSQISTLGWVCWDQLIFDAEPVFCFLSEISKLPGSLRTKAVLKTNEGWWSFNFIHGIEEVKPSGYRRDSRIEIMIDGDQYPDPNMLQDKLQKCLIVSS